MIKKTISYTDFNGTTRNEDHYFHISQAEMAEMEMSTTGGLTEMIKRIVTAQDMPAIMKVFKEFILKSYGVKSPDGRMFIKIDKDGHRLADDFAQTEAYNQLFMELIKDVDKASAFFNEIIESSKPQQTTPAVN